MIREQGRLEKRLEDEETARQEKMKNLADLAEWYFDTTSCQQCGKLRVSAFSCPYCQGA